MKFPTDRPVKVVMLGAGGTGGYVAPYVFRLLHMLDRPARFVVCDGDIVEPKNLDRQNFVPADLGENKARVLAERYSTVLGMETEYVPSFIEKLPDLMELIEPKEWELNPYSTKRTKEMVCGSEHQGTGRYERQQHACYAPSAGRQADPGLRPRRTARTEHRHRSEQCKAHHASAGYRGILRAGILRDRPARGQGGINSDSAKNGKEQFFEKDRAVSNYQPDAFGLQVL